jgi:hypothetical protein
MAGKGVTQSDPSFDSFFLARKGNQSCLKVIGLKWSAAATVQITGEHVVWRALLGDWASLFLTAERPPQMT